MRDQLYERNLKKKKDRREEKDLKCSGGKFDPNCGFGLQAELIPGESREEIGLADSRIAN